MAKTSRSRETASQAYARTYTEVDALLAIVRERVNGMLADCCGADWSHVGSLASVRDALAQVAVGLDLGDLDEKAAAGRLAVEVARVSKERS